MITNQPADAIVEETKGATFNVGVAGRGARFQWFREGTGAIAMPRSHPSAFPSRPRMIAGNYYVVVSNDWGALTSWLARLTIVPDTNAPLLLEADGTLGATSVLLSFSEAITSETATNRNNYRITNTLTGATLAISGAIQTSTTNVLLAIAPRASGQNYILVANGIRDISMRGNLVPTNSSARSPHSCGSSVGCGLHFLRSVPAVRCANAGSVLERDGVRSRS
jgi:hypothetical protein